MKIFKKSLAILFALMFAFSAISVSAISSADYVKWESNNGTKFVNCYDCGEITSTDKFVYEEKPVPSIFKFTPDSTGFYAFTIAGGEIKCSDEIRNGKPYNYAFSMHAEDVDYNDVYLFNFDDDDVSNGVFLQVAFTTKKATYADVAIKSLGTVSSVKPVMTYYKGEKYVVEEKDFLYTPEGVIVSSNSNKDGIKEGVLSVFNFTYRLIDVDNIVRTDNIKVSFADGDYVIDSDVISTFPKDQVVKGGLEYNKEYTFTLDELDADLTFKAVKLVPVEKTLCEKIKDFFLMVWDYIVIGGKAIFDFFRTLIKNWI